MNYFFDTVFIVFHLFTSHFSCTVLFVSFLGSRTKPNPRFLVLTRNDRKSLSDLDLYVPVQVEKKLCVTGVDACDVILNERYDLKRDMKDLGFMLLLYVSKQNQPGIPRCTRNDRKPLSGLVGNVHVQLEKSCASQARTPATRLIKRNS